METFALQIELGWPRKPLFNYLADIDNNPGWQAHVVESEWVSKPPSRTGSTFKEIWLISDRHTEVRFREERFVKGENRTLTGFLKGFKLAIAFHFSEHAGKTTLGVIVKCDSERQDAAAFSEWLRSTYERNLERLKELIEEDNKKFSDIFLDSDYANVESIQNS
jgi:hypothetical protein